MTRFLQQRVNSTDGINRHAGVFATQAGSLGYITPLLNESMEPLLQKLQRQMVVAQPQPAGLNPAAFRCISFSDDVGCCLKIVLGLQSMLFIHVTLPEAACRQLAIGKTSCENVCDVLMIILCRADHQVSLKA